MHLKLRSKSLLLWYRVVHRLLCWLKDRMATLRCSDIKDFVVADGWKASCVANHCVVDGECSSAAAIVLCSWAPSCIFVSKKSILFLMQELSVLTCQFLWGMERFRLRVRSGISIMIDLLSGAVRRWDAWNAFVECVTGFERPIPPIPHCET